MPDVIKSGVGGRHSADPSPNLDRPVSPTRQPTLAPRGAPARPVRPGRALLWVSGGVAARALSHGATLLLTVAAARVLGPQDMGSFVLASALLALAMLLLYAGVYEYLLRADDACLQADAGFSILLAMASALSLALWALAPAAGGWLDRKSTRLNSSHSQQSRMPSSA